MQKEGQLNTSFQERYFMLWPRDECKLVPRGFRVLYYFDTPNTAKANGRILIDQPDIENLTTERQGQCVMRINPSSEASDQANGAGGMDLKMFLESRKLAALDARPLTLRWNSSNQSEDFENMKNWSVALGGRRTEEQVEMGSDAEGAAKSAVTA